MLDKFILLLFHMHRQKNISHSDRLLPDSPYLFLSHTRKHLLTSSCDSDIIMLQGKQGWVTLLPCSEKLTIYKVKLPDQS